MEDRRTYESQKKIIEETIDAALNRQHLPCELQGEQLRQVHEAIATLVKQMTGNGQPKEGIIYRFSLVEAKVSEMVRERRAIATAVIGLILVTIWELISK